MTNTNNPYALSFIAVFVAMATVFTAANSNAGETDGLDMTGTWQGSVKCQGLDDFGEKEKYEVSGEIHIGAAAQTVAVSINGLESDGEEIRGGGLSPELCGLSIEQAGKSGKGQVSLDSFFYSGCVGRGGCVAPRGRNFDPAQSVRWKTVKLFDEKSNGVSGLLKGTSILSYTAGGSTTCAWKFDRVSTEDPGVSVFNCLGI